MRNDEFNEVKVTNNKESFSYEFSRVQKDESTSYKENKDNDLRDELNLTHNKNNENIKHGKTTNTNSKEIIEKAVQQSSSAVSGQTAAVASSGASAGAAASTSAASSIIGAVVVATTAIATTIGISVISSNNAKCTMQEFFISDNMVFYSLLLEDTNDDPFKLYITNASFMTYRDLEEGQNSGEVEGLVWGETYRLYVQEDSDNAKIIYDTTFVMKEHYEEYSEIYGIYVGQNTDLLNYTFEVYISYYDGKGIFSNDAILTLTDIEDETKTKSFPITLGGDSYMLSALDDQTGEVILDIRKSSFNATLTYTADGEDMTFTNYETLYFNQEGLASEVYGVYFSEGADYVNYSFSFSIDLKDDFDILHDFSMLIESSSGASKTIAIDNPFNTCYVSGEEDGEVILDVRNDSFTYDLTYFEGDEEKHIVSQESFTFVDNSGYEPSINGVTLQDNPDFLNYQFNVLIDYSDVFGVFGEQASLTFTDVNDNSKTLTQDIILSNEPITIDGKDANEEVILDIRNSTFTATLNYTQDGEEMEFVQNNLSYNPNGELKSEFNGINISETANFVDYTFTITLDVQDDFGLFDRFYIYIESSSGGHLNLDIDDPFNPIVINGKDENSGEVILDVRHDTFTYEFVYYEEGNMVQLSSQESFSFTDNSGYEASFTSFYIDERADFNNNTIYVTMNFSDEFDEFTNFLLTISSDDGTSDPITAEISLSHTTETLEINAMEYGLDITTGQTFTYQFSYSYNNNQIEYVSGEITFINSLDSNFNGLNTDYKVYQVNEEQYYLPVQLDYVDNADIYWSFHLLINGDENNEIILENTTGYQFVDVTNFMESIGKESAFGLNIEYYDYATKESVTENFWSETATMTLSEDPIVYGARLTNQESTYESATIGLVPAIYDPEGTTFTNYKIYLTTLTDNETYEFDIDLSEFENLFDAFVEIPLYQHENFETLRAQLEDEDCRVNIVMEYTDTRTSESANITISSNVRLIFYA
ncbi:MAG: hypothetical protein K6C32_05195 [Bacilli bacterium]|nr:hypothetical protein [Bacilli bacterium]